MCAVAVTLRQEGAEEWRARCTPRGESACFSWICHTLSMHHRACGARAPLTKDGQCGAALHICHVRFSECERKFSWGKLACAAQRMGTRNQRWSDEGLSCTFSPWVSMNERGNSHGETGVRGAGAPLTNDGPMRGPRSVHFLCALQ